MSLSAYEEILWEEIVAGYDPDMDSVELASKDFRAIRAVELLMEQGQIEAVVNEVPLSLSVDITDTEFDMHDRYYYEDGVEMLAQVADEYGLSPENMGRALKLAEGKVV